MRTNYCSLKINWDDFKIYNNSMQIIKQILGVWCICHFSLQMMSNLLVFAHLMSRYSRAEIWVAYTHIVWTQTTHMPHEEFLKFFNHIVQKNVPCLQAHRNRITAFIHISTNQIIHISYFLHIKLRVISKKNGVVI